MSILEIMEFFKRNTLVNIATNPIEVCSKSWMPGGGVFHEIHARIQVWVCRKIQANAHVPIRQGAKAKVPSGPTSGIGRGRKIGRDRTRKDKRAPLDALFAQPP